MAPFMLLAVLYLAGLVGGLILVLRSTARVNASQIKGFPSTIDLYTAVIVSAFKPKKAGKTRKVEGLQVRHTMTRAQVHMSTYGLQGQCHRNVQDASVRPT
jgi:hypothetical protein